MKLILQTDKLSTTAISIPLSSTRICRHMVSDSMPPYGKGSCDSAQFGQLLVCHTHLLNSDHLSYKVHAVG